MILKFELLNILLPQYILADDYSKLAFLCIDRSVCLHAKYGSHYSLRIPRFTFLTLFEVVVLYENYLCILKC